MIRYRVVFHHPDEPRDFQRFSRTREEADSIFDEQMKVAREGALGRIVEVTEAVVRQQPKAAEVRG